MCFVGPFQPHPRGWVVPQSVADLLAGGLLLSGLTHLVVGPEVSLSLGFLIGN